MNRSNTAGQSVSTLVLGAGLTGLSVAYHLGEGCQVVEANDQPGGTAGTLRHGPFHLDHGVHILYFRDPWTHSFITKELGVSLRRNERDAVVWFDKKWVPFPIQFHLSSLSLGRRLKLGGSWLAAAIATEFVSGSDTHNLAHWSREHLGQELTTEFFRPYNEKLWGVRLEELTSDWMDGYVPKPGVTAVLKGLVLGHSERFGRNASFWYPEHGGISTVADSLAHKIEAVQYGMRLTRLDVNDRIATFDNGSEISYKRLVSTIPLVELASCTVGQDMPPVQVKASLRSNPTTILHLLIPRPRIGNGHHWIYCPQADVPFYRVTLPHNISSGTCPRGWSALSLVIGGTVEDKELCGTRSKKALEAMGLLSPGESGIEMLWKELQHGYVTYDQNRPATRREILAAYRNHGVICLGRFGRWEYSNMESALVQGREIGQRFRRRQLPSAGVPYRAIPKDKSRVRSYFANEYSAQVSGWKRLVFKRGEASRLACLRRLVPQTEGISILDAGCGDGSFLARSLNGTPVHIRLEDLVVENVQQAAWRLADKADMIEAAVGDVSTLGSSAKYDLVLALGIFDYAKDWELLLTRLVERTEGQLILDIPKSRTVHSRLRQMWLRWHGLRLYSGDKDQFEQLMQRCRLSGDIIELPFHWMVRISALPNHSHEVAI